MVHTFADHNKESSYKNPALWAPSGSGGLMRFYKDVLTPIAKCRSIVLQSRSFNKSEANYSKPLNP